MSQGFIDLLLVTGFGLLILAALSLYLYCIIDINRQKVRYLSSKQVWLLVVWTMPIIGSLIYLSQRKRYWAKQARY
jgi:hypothetical protein